MRFHGSRTLDWQQVEGNLMRENLKSRVCRHSTLQDLMCGITGFW